MTTTPVRPDGTIPVEVSWEYQLTTPGSPDWVEVTDIVDGIVQVRGLYNTIAAWEVPISRFDDLMVSYIVGGYILTTEDLLFDITSEDGDDLVGK